MVKETIGFGDHVSSEPWGHGVSQDAGSECAGVQGRQADQENLEGKRDRRREKEGKQLRMGGD